MQNIPSSTQFSAQLSQALWDGFWGGIWMTVKLFAGVIWASFVQYPVLMTVCVLLLGLIAVLKLKEAW